MKGIYSKNQAYGIAIFSFVLFFLVSLLTINSPSSSDEPVYHYPNFINFYQNGWNAIFNKSYSVANTPLPYIICWAASKVFTPSLFLVRLITAVISLFAFFLMARILELQKSPAYLSVVFLFYPYFLLNSFRFYANNYGLFFALLSLLFLRIGNGTYKYVGAGLSASLAILSQQWYLAIPAGVVLSKLISEIKIGTNISSFIRRNALRFILFLFPLVLPFLIFLLWGGLTHPNFRAHAISLYPLPTAFVAILFVTGFTFAPYGLQTLRRFSARDLGVGLILSVLGVMFFRPTFSKIHGPERFTGLTHHIIILFSKFHPWLSTTVMIALVFLGVLILTQLLRDVSAEWERTVLIIAILQATICTFSMFVSERYLLGYIVCLMLLVLPRLGKTFGTAYLGAMLLIGTSYFVYELFLKV